MNHPIQILTGPSYCPTCDKSFDNVGVHWARWCEYPSLTEEQHEILAGLLLGGASPLTQSGNPSIRATTRYRDLAIWTADQLGWLTSSLRRVSVESSVSDDDTYTYQAATRNHPELERYMQWFDDEGRSPPISSMRLSRRVVRTWYAYSAYVAWSSAHESRETAFSAVSDEKRAWVGDLLKQLGYDPTYRRDSWYLSAAETRDLLEWVGGPVPGVEHKWAFRRAAYDEIRDRQESVREWYRDNPRAETDFEADLYPPGEYDPLEPGIPTWEPSRDLHRQYSNEDCLEALLEVATTVGVDILELTIAEYERNRPTASTPGRSLLANRFGGWEAAKEKADRKQSETITRADAARALLEVDERVEGPFTLAAYEEHRDDDHPAAGAISNQFGWDDLKAAVGLE